VADVQGVNLLGGLIQATELKSVANTTATRFLARSSSTGTTFTGLKVAGISIVGTPRPNTKINLLGLGSVTLNEQSFPTIGPNESDIYVVAIDISVTVPLNLFGIPVGTHITVAAAGSNFSRPAFPVTLGGDAYALYAIGLNGAVTSGPWSLVFLPSCTGGTNTVSLATVSLPGIVSTGTMTDTITGSINSQGGTVTSTSTIQGVNLLGGLITADAITGTATASYGTSGSTSASTTLANFNIGGIAVTANPGPNTFLAVPGFGYVEFNEQYNNTTTGLAAMQMHAVDIFITVPNPLLPIGARIFLGSADAVVTLLSSGSSSPQSHVVTPFSTTKEQAKTLLPR